MMRNNREEERENKTRHHTKFGERSALFVVGEMRVGVAFRWYWCGVEKKPNEKKG